MAVVPSAGGDAAPTNGRLAARWGVGALLLVAAGVSATLGLLAVRREPEPLAWPALRNATYPTSVGTRVLRDGAFEAEAAPGSASRILVRLVDLAGFGDLDGDGSLDAAVLLVSSGGGSGTFVDLAAVRNEGGAAHPVAFALLGDRVLAREVRVEDGRILVRLRARGATDPLALVTREVSRRYALQEGRLVLLDEVAADVPLTPVDQFVYRPERVDLAPGAGRTLQGSLPPGQIASYVVRGEAGQVLDLTARSLFNNGVLSVLGLSDGLTLVSRREYAVRRSLLLPAPQDYAIKVVNVAGHPLAFELAVELRAVQRTPAPTTPPTSAPLPSRTPAAATPPAATGVVERPLAQLSEAAETSARSRSPVWGVAVAVPSRAFVFTANADEQVPTASVVKVMIMLSVLDRARQDRRPASEEELALLWPMITESDNDATSELWESVGRGAAVASYLRSVGVTGFTPDPGTSWGVSFVSARAMATLLGKLIGEEILDAPSRALALRMLEGVIPPQRWGVAAGTDAATGDRVGIKNGWYPGEEGWRVNSVGVVRPSAGPAYVIAIVTDARPSMSEGIATIESIAAQVNRQMRQAAP